MGYTFRMARRKTRSLKNLIFRHEIAILLLVAVTGAIGASSAYFWQQNSAESVRINSMFFFTEQIRGEMYAQIQEMIRARILEDKDAFDAYSAYSRTISERFNELRRRSGSREEDLAIQELNLAYREIQGDMNNLFNDPYIANRLARIQILEPQFAQRMVGEFERCYQEFKDVLGKQHSRLDITLQTWTRFAPFIIPIPLLIASIIVLYTRQVMRNDFIKPIANVMQLARKISRGELEQAISESGVEEVSSLAGVINKMSAELAEKRDALIENERQAALGSLVPVVAHNIRNPLASIRATAQLLEHVENQAEIVESKNEIIQTIDRLGRWVSALVSYLHPLKPDPVQARPADLLNAALGLLQNKVSEKQLNITKSGWQHNHELTADPDLMEQALFSLLANAIDASPKGSHISIALANPGDYIEIRITDSGPGLPFRPKPGDLEPGPSTKRFGTGLGIPIAFKICQKHGWNLTFHRPENGGTEVVVAAPVHSLEKAV